MFDVAEHAVTVAVQWLRLGLEVIGAAVVALGGARGLIAFIARPGGGGEQSFGPARLTLARHLSLALEFQLAADILSTTIAPSWDMLGKLAAIATIRTGLNYFLGREMAQQGHSLAS
jgi:uncharacterized membrane protein